MSLTLLEKIVLFGELRRVTEGLTKEMKEMDGLLNRLDRLWPKIRPYVDSVTVREVEASMGGNASRNLTRLLVVLNSLLGVGIK